MAIAKRTGELLAQQPAPEVITIPEEAELTYPDNDPEPAPPPPRPVAALGEAPASVNVRVTICGREVQITLRDTDEARLLERLQEVLQRYPLPQPEAPRGPKPESQGKDFCQMHQCAMTLNNKQGRQWWSHRTADGWCKGR